MSDQCMGLPLGYSGDEMRLKIYIIGRSNFVASAFGGFLAAPETSSRRTAIATEAEELVEAAGRVC